MKKVVKLLSYAFLGCFLVVASALANVEKSKKVADPSENRVREQFISNLSGIPFDNDDTSEVYISFAVSAKNGLEITRVTSENSDLANRVKETLKLKAKHFEVPASLNGKYLIKIRFIKE